VEAFTEPARGLLPSLFKDVQLIAECIKSERNMAAGETTDEDDDDNNDNDEVDEEISSFICANGSIVKDF
jgi:hypothetical protein